jgi:hypothetical protein
MNGSSSACPCESPMFPQTISNLPGLNNIAYRVGDYTAFREALLRSCPGEVELVNWRPGAQGDLAVQMVEWWAYLADILTFYNQRIANQDYLGTADLAESVQRLIAILGYRPRPGIGATGTLAALMTGNTPLTLPQGFQVSSKPGPGEQPQVFELGSPAQVMQPDIISADPAPSPLLLGSGGASVLLQGAITSVKPGDTLLLIENGWSGTDGNYGVLTVESVAPEKDPRGNTNTRIVFDEAPTQLAAANATDYQLLRSSQSTHVWQYGDQQVLYPNHVDLDSIVRGIKVGDPLLFQVGNASGSRGIYFSPNGFNLGGGGSTISYGAPDRAAALMIAYQGGIITAFEDGSIYYSPDGTNPAGGGDTVEVDSGAQQQVVTMISYQPPGKGPGVLTAFADGTIYFSPDGKNLGGGGNSSQVYGGPVIVDTMIAYQTGVIVSFQDDFGSIFYSPDGTNLYQSQATALQNGTYSPPAAMAVYGNQVITAYYEEAGENIYLSSGTTLQNQQVATIAGFANITLVPYGANAVMSIVQNPWSHVTTVYNSTDGQNLASVQGNTTQVYSGPNLILAMIGYQTGVITAFNDGTAYYSPDGQNLKGGGNTIQVCKTVPSQICLLAYNNGVAAGFPNPYALASVTSYSEVVWYANADPGNPTQPPSGSPQPIGIPIPHTSLGLQFYIANISDAQASSTLVLFNWRAAGTIIPTPEATLNGTQLQLTAPIPAALLPISGQNVLIGDANGNGLEAQAGVSASAPAIVNLSGLGSPLPNLAAPFNVLFNLLPVSRGQTVANEILGSGDATVTTGQEFVLKKSPLTYLQSADSTSGFGYSSTLHVWVDGVEWQEAPSFFGQLPNATVFVTYEDSQNMTHVQFGDGVYGSRLPSGVNNVVATYRYGSGADAPDVNTLSVILKSWPGLKGIMNPVAAGGGADPDPPDQIKTYAPQSVLTFGRAISADDYEAIAAEAPGVARARAYWSWDAAQERMMVKIYVGDDATAVADAQTALANAGDPNRPVNVLPAGAVAVTLSLTVIVDPSYVPTNVSAAVTAALIDANVGLLGSNAIGIGASIWQSQIYQACQSVPGVIAVHNLQFARKEILFPFVFRKPIFRLPILGQFVPFQPQCTCQDVRLDPGEGGYLQLAATDFNPTWEVAPNAG